MALTEQEIKQLSEWIASSSVGNMPIERPVTPSVAFLDSSPMQEGSLLGGAPRLSETTRRAYTKKAAVAAKKKRASKAAARKLPKGKRHHSAKKATIERNKRKRWATQPLKSLCYGAGVWTITQEDWDRTLGRFWKNHNPLRLEVQRKWGEGTREKPYTIYSLKLWLLKANGERKKLLYDGGVQYWHDLTAPNELDIKKAPEGALLFCMS